MGFNALAGNAALKRQLTAQQAGRGLSHAYLISGPAGSGKRTLSKLLAAALVCTGSGTPPCGVCSNCRKVREGIHPDVVTVGADGKDITVAQARTVRSDAYIRPNEAPRKVYIFQNAQTMNPSAQNALLKLLEEGPAYAAFLLLTDNPGALLPTIRSRCEGLTLSPVPFDEAERCLARRFPGRSPEEIRAAAEQGGGLLGPAVAILEGGTGADDVRQAARTLLSLLIQGDELSLAQWCVGLEKWDRETLSQMMAAAVVLLRDAVAIQAAVAVQSGPEDRQAAAQAAKLPRKRLLAAVSLLERLQAATRFNVRSDHLCGALCAGLSA